MLPCRPFSPLGSAPDGSRGSKGTPCRGYTDQYHCATPCGGCALRALDPSGPQRAWMTPEDLGLLPPK